MGGKSESMNADDYEAQLCNQLTAKVDGEVRIQVIRDLFKRVAGEIAVADCPSGTAIRSYLATWWRVIGTGIETALSLTLLNNASDMFMAIRDGFMSCHQALSACITRAGHDLMSKDAGIAFSGLYLAYTSATRAALESPYVIADPSLGCDILLGLEAIVPMDNKGTSNVYKRSRQVSDDSVRGVLSSMKPENPPETFEEAEVVLNDASSAFERFWTMMDISRRSEPELLTETKSWGKFSQSATAALAVLLEQPDSLDSLSWISREPIEYECKESSFAIQLSSASFRRRAVLNILFTCLYVSQNSSNALISAAARTLYNTVLKSLPSEFQQAITMAAKFDTQWTAWKSLAPVSKEVCGPFEKRSRIERGLEVYGEAVIDLSSITPSTIMHATDSHHPVVDMLEAESTSVDQSGTELRTETLGRKILEYRQYVSDAILCDISDDTERERLAASDEGMEEAMRNNNDRVLLWQFRRMRFATDMKSFYKHKLAPQARESHGNIDSAISTPIAQSPE